MPKERTINPAAAQRKADKQKEINKSRKQQQAQRNEKLAKRNPERIQRQIDELKELEQRGVLRPKDKETLTQLERDAKGIRRAREALGDAAPKFPSYEKKDVRSEQSERRQHLGKRRREDEDAGEGSDTDPEVRSIPMPRDTPPPIPRERFVDPQIGADGQRVPHALPTKPAVLPAPKVVYSSAPQLRDLRKEATRFVPAAVARKSKSVKGSGRLLEPEELDKLEQDAKAAAQMAADEAGLEARFDQVSSEVRAEGMNADDLDEEARRLEKELAEIYPQAETEMKGARGVAIEEVEDDGT